MTSFLADVFQANQHGTKKITIPKDLCGPDGKEIKPGDEVKVEIKEVNKQGDT